MAGSADTDFAGLRRELDRLEGQVAAVLWRHARDYFDNLLKGVRRFGWSAADFASASYPLAARLELALTKVAEAGFASGAERIRRMVGIRDWRPADFPVTQLARRPTPTGEAVIAVAEAEGLFAPPTEAIARYTTERVPPLVRVTDCYRRKAQRVVIEAREAGASLTELRGSLQELFPAFPRHRIENIARTETMTCYHQGLGASMYQNPLVEGFEWSAAMDEATCDVCSSLDGRTFQFGTQGALSYSPPAHCMCRCSPLPLIIGQETRWTGAPADTDLQPGFGRFPIEGLERPDRQRFFQSVARELT